jgi:hypothetical protein
VRAAVDALALADLTARVSANPPQCGLYQPDHSIQAAPAGRCSADVLFDTVDGVRVAVERLTMTPEDVAQKVEHVRIDTGTFFVSNIPTGYHIGSPMFRAAFKQLDSGGQVIDVIFARTMSKAPNPGEPSESTVDGFGLGGLSDFPATHQPLPEIRNSIVLTKESATTSKPYLAAHELGHVLIDNGLHVYAPGTSRQFVDALMWSAPGDTLGAHYCLVEHDPPVDNWEHFRLTGGNGWLDYSQPFGAARINAVQRIFGKAATNYLQDV